MTEGAVIAALNRVHERLAAADAWVQLEVFSGMSDQELLVMAALEHAQRVHGVYPVRSQGCTPIPPQDTYGTVGIVDTKVAV